MNEDAADPTAADDDFLDRIARRVLRRKGYSGEALEQRLKMLKTMEFPRLSALLRQKPPVE